MPIFITIVPQIWSDNGVIVYSLGWEKPRGYASSMTMTRPENKAATREPLAGRRVAVLVWSVALLAMAALLAGGAAVAAAVQQRPAPHAVLDAVFTTRGYVANGPAPRAVYELWTDAALSRARLQLRSNGQTLYYLRDGSGVWYAVGRASGSPWQRTRLAAVQQPSLLSQDGVRRLFAALRRRAGRAAVPTALHDRMAVAFPSTAVTWPYRYVGRMTVWLDAVTGLPLQFRGTELDGKDTATVMTTVDRLRTVNSSSLPSGFFAPPDQRPSLWESAVRSVAAWLTRL